jgi:hypothetical protein
LPTAFFFLGNLGFKAKLMLSRRSDESQFCQLEWKSRYVSPLHRWRSPTSSEWCSRRSRTTDSGGKVARLTSNGREARDTYPQLLGIVEQLWLVRS